ncbi:hypothetical protein AWB82_06389 [Caballeronia glebae]|uniref:Uncharacterized protein n=1 Tax=Caballeronia glebae TaxID=1777143 RepID=A0A158D8K6_9BURK|nr:hypothetical protein AWB82_06389 [Caballeronia glebae]
MTGSGTMLGTITTNTMATGAITATMAARGWTGIATTAMTGASIESGSSGKRVKRILQPRFERAFYSERRLRIASVVCEHVNGSSEE